MSFANWTIDLFDKNFLLQVTIRSCFNWIGPQDEESGMTMLSVEIPTGYAYEQFDGLKLIRTGIVPELKEVDATQNGQTIWYFNHIPKDVRCFEHTVRIKKILFLHSKFTCCVLHLMKSKISF